MSSSSGPWAGPLPLLAAVLAGAGTGLYVWSVRRRGREAPPPAADAGCWRRVGTLSELYFFPLKSGHHIKMHSLEASELGLRNDALRDRSLVVSDAAGNFVSARTHPRLERVVPSIDGQVLTLRVWDYRVTAVDCGNEAAAWIRKAIVEKEKHGEAGVVADLRLMFYPKQQSDRAKDGNVKDLGLYADKSSYSLVSRASLDDLNGRLERPVTVLNFRSNFVVDGPEAYEEDLWKWIRVGEKAIFRVRTPCSRCIMTTVDPETGVKSPDMEPLKTLKTYRLAEGELRKITGSAPIFALWMGIYATGPIALGDPVYVPV